MYSGAISGMEPSACWASAITIISCSIIFRQSKSVISPGPLSQSCSSHPSFSLAGQSVHTVIQLLFTALLTRSKVLLKSGLEHENDAMREAAALYMKSEWSEMMTESDGKSTPSLPQS